jgi:hypothetical protein
MKKPFELRPRRGRPRKFNTPSRAITLTLPEDVIAALHGIHPDVSRAVVRIAHREGAAARPRPPAELSTFGRRAVILVTPSPLLESTGVVLVPLADGRALISFDETMNTTRLELALRDTLDEGRLSQEDERLFKAVADLLKGARLSKSVELHQRQIIVLESVKRRRPAKAADRPRPRR